LTEEIDRNYITADTYSHVREKMQRDASNKFVIDNGGNITLIFMLKLGKTRGENYLAKTDKRFDSLEHYTAIGFLNSVYDNDAKMFLDAY